ncbi:PAAR domain-containing protein [Elstera cyanobacteriorum]|uniref:PAAR domain-containing protein n=1 Tax=Elstera cyanobacteriorum TaxID=2022747 RepID=UPI00235644BE|nr:PAAR domain-containing protein [Elstera cyanobacteriorum]MCK6444069.1 PAAR domain-containing protein [Elstera cyanobacteriorum]
MFDKTQACVGDVATCPIHGLTRVTEGVKAFTIAGRAMSHIGHRTACGATITTGSDFYFLNGAGAALEGSETDHGGLLLRNRFHTFVGTAERDQTARALRNAAATGNAVALACDTDEELPADHPRPPTSPDPLPPETLVPIASDAAALAVIDPAVLPEALSRLVDHPGSALCLLGPGVSAPVLGTAPWLTKLQPETPLADWLAGQAVPWGGYCPVSQETDIAALQAHLLPATQTTQADGTSAIMRWWDGRVRSGLPLADDPAFTPLQTVLSGFIPAGGEVRLRLISGGVSA